MDVLIWFKSLPCFLIQAEESRKPGMTYTYPNTHKIYPNIHQIYFNFLFQNNFFNNFTILLCPQTS